MSLRSIIGWESTMLLPEEQRFSDVAPNPSVFHETPETSRSYWIREHQIDFEQECEEAKLPEVVDVVIIGTGITGAAVAYRIAEADPTLRVAMLEARGICTGATGRNGGHITRAEAYNFRALSKVFGVDETIRLRKMTLMNRDMMLEAVEKLGAAEKVELNLSGSAAIFATQEERDTFAADMQAAKENGYDCECVILEPEELKKRIDITDERAKYGTAFLQKAGTIYPRKFVAELLRGARKAMPNLSIHTFAPATQIIRPEVYSKESFYTVKTPKGDIRARAIFHATNGWANNLLESLRSRETGVFPTKAHVMAVVPSNPAPKRPLTLSMGYSSASHWMAAQPNGILVYGYSGHGEVEAEYDDTNTVPPDHVKRKVMSEFLPSAFPGSFPTVDLNKDIKYDWTGVLSYTRTGASIVGRPDPESAGEFVSVGHNGEGMSRCFISATVATQLMLDWLKNGDAASYTPPAWFPHSYQRNCQNPPVAPNKKGSQI